MEGQLLELVHFVTRWLHVFFGIIWIGHLYYFNFTQGAFMAEADAGTKSGVLTKLLPRALWWFRWGAMWTMLTGVAMLGFFGKQYYSAEFGWNATGIMTLVGSLLGLTMWANVWFIIWPNQKVVIASATQVASGGAALPDAAASGAKALLASRTNTLFSVPMLFFMLSARHLGTVSVTPESNVNLFWGIILITWLAIEANAIKGKLGPITTIKGVITGGFVLTAWIYAVMSFTL
ncbi:MAG: urate hydroxylase PuuD [Proteobacteria bacterium]|nr:urate hydroxylase PuuD [Pseudomonadota bacterium]